jgi:alpha-L-arabinofuranosidase
VILGVWDGLSIGKYGSSGTSGFQTVPEEQLQPYIDDAINQIEFITADAETSQWGALRASYGRKEPYSLKYVEM